MSGDIENGRTSVRMKVGRIATMTAILAISAFPVSQAAFSKSVALSSSEADGPYVLRAPNGSWQVRRSGAADADDHAGSATGASVRVPAVDGVPEFEVRLRDVPAVSPASVPLSPDVPLFVLADTHGELGIVVQLLQNQGVIDERLRWAFGEGHLVVLGDVFDRGAYQTESLWLLYKLEGEAREAGGALRLALGNHEAMVLRGDLRYLHPKYPEVARALGFGSYAELFASDTLLGQWLRTKPALVKLGGTLFLHGGISPDLVRSGLSIEEINAIVRRSLEVPAGDNLLDEQARLVTGPLGPLWYRGYFPEQSGVPAATAADIDASLKHFGVGRIFVGHTIVEHVTPLHDGRVIAVQVYPHREEQTGDAVMEAAVREGGVWKRANIDGARVVLLPDDASALAR